MKKVATISDAFPWVLKHYRHQAGLTQEQVSERVGVSPSFVGMLETGLKKPNLAMLFKLSQALGVPASTMVTTLEEEWRKRSAPLQSADDNRH